MSVYRTNKKHWIIIQFLHTVSTILTVPKTKQKKKKYRFFSVIYSAYVCSHSKYTLFRFSFRKYHSNVSIDWSIFSLASSVNDTIMNIEKSFIFNYSKQWNRKYSQQKKWPLKFNWKWKCQQIVTGHRILFKLIDNNNFLGILCHYCLRIMLLMMLIAQPNAKLIIQWEWGNRFHQVCHHVRVLYPLWSLWEMIPLRSGPWWGP